MARKRYEVKITGSAKRQLKRINQKDRQAIFNAIIALAGNPRPRGSKKLTNEELHRIRVGEFRVLYTIDEGRLVVVVVRIGHRREVYRRTT